MATKETAIEVKVGALVVFSLLLLGGFIYILGDFKLDEGVEIHVDFNDIAGLKPGAPVKLAGIQIGTVKNIAFEGGEVEQAHGDAAWARVTLEIDQDRFEAVRTGSEFFITSEGVLGEKFISIHPVPPGAKSGVEAAKEEQVFRGVDPFRMEEMIAKVSLSLDNLNDLLADDEASIKELIKHIDSLVVHTDELLMENRDTLSNIVKHADKLVLDADNFVLNADAMLAENREGIRSIVGNIDALSQSGRSTLRTVDALVSRVDSAFRPALDSLMVTLSNAEQVSETVLRITNDAEPKVAGVLDDAQMALNDVKGVTTSAREMIAYIQAGNGTIGMLLRDEEIFDNMRELMRELKRRPWKIVWKE